MKFAVNIHAHTHSIRKVYLFRVSLLHNRAQSVQQYRTHTAVYYEFSSSYMRVQTNCSIPLPQTYAHTHKHTYSHSLLEPAEPAACLN